MSKEHVKCTCNACEESEKIKDLVKALDFDEWRVINQKQLDELNKREYVYHLPK